MRTTRAGAANLFRPSDGASTQASASPYRTHHHPVTSTSMSGESRGRDRTPERGAESRRTIGRTDAATERGNRAPRSASRFDQHEGASTVPGRRKEATRTPGTAQSKRENTRVGQMLGRCRTRVRVAGEFVPDGHERRGPRDPQDRQSGTVGPTNPRLGLLTTCRPGRR